jgi:uncharacterized protein YjbI with pentapeptide repeats
MANFTDAVVTGVDFGFTHYFDPSQLYSTASYQARDLTGIRFYYNNLSGWNFVGQNLTNTNFYSTTLSAADFSAADLRGAIVNLDFTIHNNTIGPEGRIQRLQLTNSQTLLVRDYHGDSRPFPVGPAGPIPIIVEQSMLMDSTGTLHLRFEAVPWDSPISFSPAIPVTLGGTLKLDFAAGVDVASQVGRTIRIFDWSGASPTGQFTVASPFTWNLSNLYISGEVTLSSVPEPAAELLAAVVGIGACLFGKQPRKGGLRKAGDCPLLRSLRSKRGLSPSLTPDSGFEIASS